MAQTKYYCEYCCEKRCDTDDISQPSSNRDKIITPIEHYGYYFCKDCKSILLSDNSAENSSVDVIKKARTYIDTIQSFLEEKNKTFKKVIPPKTENDKELLNFASAFHSIKCEMLFFIEKDANIYQKHFGELFYKLLELNEKYNTFVKEEKHV